MKFSDLKLTGAKFFFFYLCAAAILSSTFFVSNSTAADIACGMTVDQWTQVANSIQSNGKTCQIVIDRSYENGPCGKSERKLWEEHGKMVYEDVCLRWKTISRFTQARAHCAGHLVLNAREVCTIKDSTRDQIDVQLPIPDYSVSSIFIESMAQKGFRMIKLESSRYFFER